MSLLKTYQEKLGPGLVFAAVAVGVSHLIQSTRAGAEYGLSLAVLIIFSCLVKYPAFRFGSDYAAATSKPLLEGYRRQGRWVLALYTMTLPIDMFISVAAISLVTSGVFKNVLFIDVSDISLSFMLLVACAALLISGRYRLFESITKTVVLVFSILTVVAAMLSIPEVNWAQDDLARPVEFDRTTLLFMIAIAGWMPTGISVSMFQSFWVYEKTRLNQGRFSVAEARFDFNMGYGGTILLALCFVLMGTVVMYRTGITTEASPAGFAAQLISMFTQVIGEWSRPIIAVAALAVMISTMLSGLDANPRIAGYLVNYFLPARKIDPVTSYSVFIVLEVIGATLILLWFLTSFKTFIDFATSVAFVMAPLLAWFNHRAVFSGDIKEPDLPGPVMRVWSILGIFVMLLVAIYFVYTKMV